MSLRHPTGLLPFADREDAGRRLATALVRAGIGGDEPVVLGLPNGGVPVALQVALRLDAPLDVVVVRKLGVPRCPELAMGAVAEGGVRVVDSAVVRLSGVTDDALRTVEDRERRELERRVALLHDVYGTVPLAGRVALVVDDGLATGTTARAACRAVRRRGADRVVLAVPVAPRGWRRRLREDADRTFCLAEPGAFGYVARHYTQFGQVDDEHVLECLARSARRTRTP